MRLLYTAPEECPGREPFVLQVRERLGNDWEAGPDELARAIEVTVSMARDRYVARIAFRDADGRSVTRAVGGTRCEQVVEGIALVTALAIQAQIEELIGQSEPIAEPADAAPPGTAPEKPAPPAKPEPQPLRAEPPSRASTSRPRLRIGARAVLQLGAGPEIGLGPGAFAAVEWPALVLGLAVDSTWTGQVEAEGVPVEFNLLAARLEACGTWFRLSTSALIEPCLTVQGGSLQARGAVDPPTVTRSSEGASLWVAPGVLLRLGARWGPIFLEVEGSGSIPLNRRQFYVDRAGQRDVVYQTPWLAGGAALGVGLVF